MIKPTIIEHADAINVGTQIAAGEADSAAERTAIVPVGGMIVMQVLLITRKRIIGSLAMPGRGLSRFSSIIALIPNGVAALPSPSMLAARFITIAPIAGWSGGTSGNTRRRTGASMREIAA